MEKQKSSTKKSVEVLELSRQRQRQLKEFVQRLSRRVYRGGGAPAARGGDKFSFAFFIIKWLTAAV